MIRVSWLIIISLCFLPLMGQRQIEEINRGLIAVRTGSNSVLVSWRWLGNEPEEMAFNVYRDGNKLNEAPVAQSTNYLDATSENGTYTVKPILNGLEGDASESAVVWSTNYMEIPLQQPAGGTTPANESYTYNANDASVGDLDGDGAYDIVLKWEPSNAKDNSQSGYTGQVIFDAYKLDGTHLWRIDLGKNIRAGAHYTQFLVYDFDGDGKSELVCKTAPGTKDGLGSFLSAGVAASDNDAADYRNSGGYVLSGPEYLTVFNGESGAEMATVNYTPPRGNVSDWGDLYGNRVDRFLAAVAYLDGEKPSIVMTRGYYTRSVLAAWDWDGTTLSQRWIFDSDAPGNSAYSGQGNHNLSVADVDGDGKDEIIFGSCTIDNDGTGLYSTGLGHGDALHVTNHDPSRPGLEVFMPHEHSGKGISYRDAASGDIIWQKKALGDIGRGVAGDISADHPGSEFWGAGMGMYNVKGEKISTTTPSMNFLIWWDGDLLRELLDGTNITKYQGGTLLSAGGCSSNNGTKSTPALQADLLGDWREEVIFRTSDNSKLRIYTTPYETSHRFRTLMHDPVYRLSVAWQNVGYNQPPHVGFFLGHDMKTPPKAPIVQSDLKWDGTSGLLWQPASGENWVDNSGVAVVYQDGLEVLFSLSGNNSGDIEIIGDLTPEKVTVNAPFNYVLGGSGSMTGSMQLIKSGVGRLTLASDHSYSGGTLVDNGLLEVNGVLNNSAVLVTADGSLTGVGTIGSGVTMGDNAQFYIGGQSYAGLTTVGSHLILDDHSRLVFDLSAQPALGNDKLIIEGDLVLESNQVKLVVNMLEDHLSSGSYALMAISGSLSGDIASVAVEGLLGYPYELELVGNELLLHVETPRTATRLVWDGSGVNTWDLMETAGWLANGVASSFAPGDTVVFNDAGTSDVNLSGNVPIGEMFFESANSYTFSGDGVISGEGGLIVSGTGTLNMTKYNEYVGPTVIKSGTLAVPFLNYGGQPSSLGAAGIEEANLVIDGGVLLFSGAESNTNRGMTFGTDGAEIEVANANSKLMLEGKTLGGTLVKSGPGRLILEGAKAHAKTVLRGGRISLFGDVASPGSSLVIESGTFDSMDDMGSYNTMTWSVEVPEGGSGTLNLDSRGTYTGKLTGSGTLYVNIPNVRSDLNGDWSA
ncbi:MAG: autotransporter-associated beta strand repeat-containing protein, partial [Bacteroidales bacterium]|nr:autotransporter-associated beta strand repeat-containing protein [Bacteroidales bacterium]